MASIVEILRTIKTEAGGAASKVESLHRANRDLISDARELSSITPTTAPATFALPPPRSGPSPFSPIVGVDGSTIGGRRTLTSSGGGGGGEGSAAGGGGGVGGQRTRADILYNLEGGSMPGEWVRAHCTPVKLRVPARTGVAAIPGDIGNFREVNAWQCPLPWGTFIEDQSVLASMSGATSGGAGGGGGAALGRARANRPNIPTSRLPGAGAGGDPVHRGFDDTPRSFPGDSTSGGLQISGQGLTLSDVVVEQRKTNTLLEKALRGDGGTGLRAGGLL